MNNRRLGVLSSEEFIDSICIDTVFINGRYDGRIIKGKTILITEPAYDMPISYDTTSVNNLACAYSFYIMYFSFVLSRLVQSEDLYIIATLDADSIFFSVCRRCVDEDDARAESKRTYGQIVEV